MSEKRLTRLKQLKNANAEVRRQAVLDLAHGPADEPVDWLIQALGDENWRVRMEAVAIASRLTKTHPELISQLIEATAHEENIGLRNAAIKALVNSGPAGIEKVLPRVFDGSADDRKTAVEIVGASGDSRAVETLTRALDDADPNVRVCAAEFLGNYQDEGALEALYQCLTKDDRVLKLAALNSLEIMQVDIPWRVLAPIKRESFLAEPLVAAMGRSGTAEAVEEVMERFVTHPAAVCAALVTLHNASKETAGAVKQSLCNLDAEGVENLVETATKTEHLVQMNATRCLLWTRDATHMVTIVQLARNSELYPILVEELTLWGAGAIATLMEMLKTATGTMRASIIGLLTRLVNDEQGRQMAGVFAADLSSDHTAVATAAAGAVSRFGDITIVDRLLELIAVNDSRMRTTAGIALADLGHRFPQEVYDEIRDMPIDGKQGIELCRVLKVVGSGSDAKHVARGLSSSDPQVRRAALSTLAVIGGKEAVRTIAKSLTDRELGVRLQGVEALSKLGDAAAQAVVDALGNATGPVQSALVRALGKIGHPDAENWISQMCQGESDVALAAIEAAKSLGISFSAIGHDVLWHSDAEVIKQALLSYKGEVSDQELLGLASHEQWDVRLEAIRCFEEREIDPQTQGALKALLKSEKNDLVANTVKAVIARVEKR